jgi:hypothetical protein
VVIANYLASRIVDEVFAAPGRWAGTGREKGART